MKRILAMSVACAALLWATAASAQDTSSQRNGNIGVGADAALNLSNAEAANGISGRYQVSDKIGAQAIFRLDYRSGPGDAAASFFNLGLRAIYNLATVQNAALGLVGGLGFYRVGTDDGNGNGLSELGIVLETGVRTEYFVTKSFSIHGEVGIVFAFLGDSFIFGDQNNGGDAVTGTAIVLGDGDLVGNAGFTFWF